MKNLLALTALLGFVGCEVHVTKDDRGKSGGGNKTSDAQETKPPPHTYAHTHSKMYKYNKPVPEVYDQMLRILREYGYRIANTDSHGSDNRSIDAFLDASDTKVRVWWNRKDHRSRTYIDMWSNHLTEYECKEAVKDYFRQINQALGEEGSD